jgi:methionine synthase I (cobalamin-dependent)
MGSSLYEKGYFINRAFDEANLIDSDKVKTIHEECLMAGAQVIQTNTFSANRILLSRYGIPEKVAEVNRRGVEIAKSAVKVLSLRTEFFNVIFLKKKNP